MPTTRYGCLLQAVIMMLLTLAAMTLYEYGFSVLADALGLSAVIMMVGGIWTANRKGWKIS